MWLEFAPLTIWWNGCSLIRCSLLKFISAAVIKLRESAYFGWCDTTHRAGWMCLPGNDHSSPTLLNSKPKKGPLPNSEILHLSIKYKTWRLCLFDVYVMSILNYFGISLVSFDNDSMTQTWNKRSYIHICFLLGI